MTAVPPESLVTEGVRSLEVRIFPDQLETGGGPMGSGGSRPGRSHARTLTCWIRGCAGCR
jgi:hypothetical protein